MDVIEIRKIYVEKLTEICTGCFDRIDNLLVYEYNIILEHKPVELYICGIYGDYEDSPYFDDVIKKIQQHYYENWEVTYNKKSRYLILLYKNDLTEVLQNPKEIEEPEEIKIVKKIEEPEEKNRFNLMDMEE